VKDPAKSRTGQSARREPGGSAGQMLTCGDSTRHYRLVAPAPAVESRTAHILEILLLFSAEHLLPGLCGEDAEHANEGTYYVSERHGEMRALIKARMNRLDSAPSSPSSPVPAPSIPASDTSTGTYLILPGSLSKRSGSFGTRSRGGFARCSSTSAPSRPEHRDRSRADSQHPSGCARQRNFLAAIAPWMNRGADQHSARS
jgi:hypothetical protein